MLLQEILDQVDTFVTNALPDSIKISWINQIQNQLYRDYPVSENVSRFTTVVGEGAYTLPDTIPIDRIKNLMVGKHLYPFAPPNDEDPGYERFWTAVVGNDIMLYPVPRVPEEVVIYYRPRPDQFTEEDRDKAPSFPLDFHELLVYGCAARVAMADEKTMNKASFFESKYSQLADKADLVLVRRRQQTVNTSARAWM